MEHLSAITNKVSEIAREIAVLPVAEAISVLNQVRLILHGVSPMKNEPVDCVLWVHHESVSANDYNPNSVAPPEMVLLEKSIVEDGYTQPVVTWLNADSREIVDGFHRGDVGKKSIAVHNRTGGFLPVTTINQSRVGRGDRIAATIRHNRARGKHHIGAMSKIVVELSRRNWSDIKIAEELGMDADEVMRLKQVTGLADMFADHDFSEAWSAQEEP